jgi:hypothetical protein
VADQGGEPRVLLTLLPPDLLPACPLVAQPPFARRRQLANLAPRPPDPPAENTRALKHGGYGKVARERIEAKVAEVYDTISLDAPLRDPDGDSPAPDAAMVRLLAVSLCRIESISAFLRDHGIVDPKTKKPRESVIYLEARLQNNGSDYLDALGMSPRSRARLGLDLARTSQFDLARHWQDEDEAIEGEAEEAEE